MYCKCHRVLTIREACKDIVDEFIEFLHGPSLDELSDIAYGVNRLFGALTKKPYRRVIIGDGLHVRKINIRMRDYGCIRSQRHLKNNACPTV